MARDNPTIEEILDQVKAANVRIRQLEGLMANSLEWRNQSIRKLRHYLPAAEIGRRVGLTRQTIYAVLRGESVTAEELDPDELGGLIHRLAESAQQFQDVADGKSALATPNPVGMQMLADNLRWAVEWLETLITEERRLDKWTHDLVAEWHDYEAHRADSRLRSRQFPHLQDIVVHQLANRLGVQHAATALNVPVEQVLDALGRPGLDGKPAVVDVNMDQLLAGGDHPESTI